MKKQLIILIFLIPFLSLNAQTPRLSLVEEFTGETCPPCAAYNPAFNNLLTQSAASVVAIKWQVPIPTAPTKIWSLYQTNKGEINWRYSSYGYGINSAPSVRIDGQMPTLFGAASENIVDMSTQVFGNAQSNVSAFSVTMNRAWNKTCTAVTLTISITATAPFTSVGALVFRTVMVEETIQFSVQPGSNGETKFEDVAIKSFPSIQAGTPMASNWVTGQTQTFTLNCPIPSYTRKKEEIAFVGFIQDDGNRKVAQAVRCGKVALPQDALSAIKATVDLTCSNVITPTLEVKNEGSVNAITALTLNPIIDGVAGTPVPWTGNIAPGATATITLNSVNSPNVMGSHTFSCDIDLPVTLYNLIKNNTRQSYMVSGAYQATPVAEGFSNAVFPPAGFGIINPDNGPGWSRSTVTGAYNISPLASVKYDFFTNTVIGDKDELYLPPMDLSSATIPVLYFDMAYAQRTSSSDDVLDILVSDDCGATWTAVFSDHGASLSTAAPSIYAYVPDPNNNSHWRTLEVDLGNYKKPNLLIKFVTTSDNGNNLYLDNINLVFNATGIQRTAATSRNVTLYPNPASGITELKMEKMTAGPATISLINALGQVVYVKQLRLTEGSNSLSLDLKDLAAGIYNVSLDSQSGTIVKKLSISK